MEKRKLTKEEVKNLVKGDIVELVYTSNMEGQTRSAHTIIMHEGKPAFSGTKYCSNPFTNAFSYQTVDSVLANFGYYNVYVSVVDNDASKEEAFKWYKQGFEDKSLSAAALIDNDDLLMRVFEIEWDTTDKPDPEINTDNPTLGNNTSIVGKEHLETFAGDALLDEKSKEHLEHLETARRNFSFDELSKESKDLLEGANEEMREKNRKERIKGALTAEQVGIVFGWMQEWDQFKNTVMPLRFKEEFIPAPEISVKQTMTMEQWQKYGNIDPLAKFILDESAPGEQPTEIPVFDEAGDPRLTSEGQKKQISKAMEDAKPDPKNAEQQNISRDQAFEWYNEGAKGMYSGVFGFKYTLKAVKGMFNCIHDKEPAAQGVQCLNPVSSSEIRAEGIERPPVNSKKSGFILEIAHKLIDRGVDITTVVSVAEKLWNDLKTKGYV